MRDGKPCGLKRMSGTIPDSVKGISTEGHFILKMTQKTYKNSTKIKACIILTAFPRLSFCFVLVWNSSLSFSSRSFLEELFFFRATSDEKDT